MKSGFWTELKKPFFILAPMEDVTDTVFRQIIAGAGSPDVFFTEFTSCEGICSPGRDSVSKRLRFTENERPLVAQIWGKTPEKYLETSKLLVEMGFDGIDINMGCPVTKIVKQGCCSALIDNPSLAIEIIEATKEGAGDLPVSVKTRIGYKSRKTEEWATTLLQQDIALLTIHGRTTKEMSKVDADWDEVKKVVEIKNRISPDTLIVGNGDVVNISQGNEYYKRYGVDGIMIGRGVFSNPWLFNGNIEFEDKSPKDKIDLMCKHVDLFEATWGDNKNYPILKKFFKIYIRGFEGANELRVSLMDTSDFEEFRSILRQFKL
jgi:nifR3 family TIM-barrel protein